MSNKSKSKTVYIVRSAAIAALYAAVTLILAPISFGVLQYRAAEALAVLTVFMPEAVPGLAAGCLIVNILGGNGVLDVIMGTLATLVSSWLSAKLGNSARKMFGEKTESGEKKRNNRRKYLLYAAAVLPQILLNGIIVGAELAYLYSLPFWLTALEVAGGEALVLVTLGAMLFAYFIKREEDGNKL